MEFVEYGDKDGQIVIYFHGVPGGMKECSIFDGHAKENNLKIICFDRFSVDHTLNRKSYYQKMADHIKHIAGEETVDIIGFSVGAHVALEVGLLLNREVRDTHLVSAAAPLNAGEFLENMAGGAIFRLATKKPLAFTLLTQCQGFIARLVPRVLVSMLFSSSVAEDKKLIKQHAFRDYITPILKHCFQDRAKGYLRDINYYTSWLGELNEHTFKVTLWHGEKDNWSPASMASYLYSAIPGAVHLELMEGLSHYSCLYESAPKICAQLKRS